MYSKKSKDELIALCKERKIKGYSGKKKEDIIALLTPSREPDIKSSSKDNVGKVREQGLDKFYTNPNIAEKCLNILETYYSWEKWSLVIEPSAGNGSFFTRIKAKNKIGIDIEPEHSEIIKKDFFDYQPPVLSVLPVSQTSYKGDILVVGNPPFGKVSSLAINFFNHASKWANVIAFIIPRTFRRISVQNRLNKNFHLIHDEEIPIGSFTPSMSVKCCFQIWERKNTERQMIDLKTSHNDWEFLSFGPKDENNQPTPPIRPDFAIRAYGGKCGEIVQENLQNLRPKSWHWIKANIDKDELIYRFKALDYSISLDTARQNSIGRGELVRLYETS
jgi:predicted RNA methylase